MAGGERVPNGWDKTKTVMQESLTRHKRSSDKCLDKQDCFLFKGMKLCVTLFTNTLVGTQTFVSSIG